uniref:Uncharacterized protein n=1 Tax=Anguilla anguilla TaxID=7936 RepID=A0A0E9Q3M1_ANGAN
MLNQIDFCIILMPVIQSDLHNFCIHLYSWI